MAVGQRMTVQKTSNIEHINAANAKSVVMKGFDGNSYPALDVDQSGRLVLSGFGLPSYDEIAATYPTAETERYTYKSDGTTVAVVDVTYADSAKTTLTGVVRSV